MQEKKQFIRDQTGDSYIDIAIVMLIIFTLLASLLAVFPVLTVQQSLNNTARQIARTVEVTGCVGTEVDQLLENLSSAEPDSLTFETTWKDPIKQTIQLKTPFTVVATKTVPIILIRPALGEPIVFEITVTATASGISEVYHK